MNADFDYILTALEAIGVEPTPREAAEALWLAAHIAQSPSTSPPKALRRPAPGGDTSAGATRASRAASPAISAPLYAGTAAAAAAAGGVSSTRAVPVRVADAPALPHELELLRALRPLKRRIPSRHRVLLDETATAERSAEERLFLPATCPEPERWLSLALVVEAGPSMVVWHSLVGELTTLLQRAGAFRDIRLWYLHSTSDGSSGLHPQASPTSALHSPREILDPTGRQAIWCISDCVSALWHEGRAHHLLELWGQGGPLALIQPLPQRLWRRTGLRPEHIRLHAGAPGLPNSRLRTSWSDSSALLRAPAAGIPVPVLELDPSWLTPWAGLITATAPSGVPAVVTMTDTTRNAASTPDHSTISPDASADDPLSLVRAFRAHASPQAYRLAGCLADAPLTLPVMRLVQRVMLPQSRPAHLAEVLLSGLLHQISSGSASPEYAFTDGVQKVLLSTVPRSDSRRVKGEVSAYLAAHAGTARDTQALAVLPTGQGNVPLTNPSQPFAEIPLRAPSRTSQSQTGAGREPTTSDQDSLGLLRADTRSQPGQPADETRRRRTRQQLISRIVDTLQQSDTMQTPEGRNLYVGLLRQDLGARIEPADGQPLRIWLWTVVNACINALDDLSSLVQAVDVIEGPSSPILTALRRLVDERVALEFFGYADLQSLRPVLETVGPTELQELARHASPSRLQELPSWCENGWQVFLRLTGDASTPNVVPSSMAFLDNVADVLAEAGRWEDAQTLLVWNRSQAHALGLANELDQWRTREPTRVSRLGATVLTIQFTPDPLSSHRYDLSHWLQKPGEAPVAGDPCLQLPVEQLERAVGQLVRQMERQMERQRLSGLTPVNLEFVLPFELLNLPVEWWARDTSEIPSVPLCVDYPVVVRSLDRLQNLAWHRLWHSRWSQLTSGPGNSRALWGTTDPDVASSHERLDRELMADPRVACLILSRPPVHPSGRRELRAGLRAGVPVVIWHRDDTSPAFREAVDAILQNASPNGLRERVAALRRRALAQDDPSEQVGRHLAILLDDPENKPAPPPLV